MQIIDVTTGCLPAHGGSTFAPNPLCIEDGLRFPGSFALRCAGTTLRRRWSYLLLPPSTCLGRPLAVRPCSLWPNPSLNFLGISSFHA
jgi:hypothetical protein